MRRLSQGLIHQADAHLHPLCKRAMTDLKFGQNSCHCLTEITPSICMFGYSLRPNLTIFVTLSKSIFSFNIYCSKVFYMLRLIRQYIVLKRWLFTYMRHSADRPWTEVFKFHVDVDTLQIMMRDTTLFSFKTLMTLFRLIQRYVLCLILLNDSTDTFFLFSFVVWHRLL